MGWKNYLLYAIPTICCWLIPTFPFVRHKRVVSCIYFAGILIYVSFIIGLWFEQGYPPLRTENDTRLWYSVFLALTGFVIYIRWDYKWLLIFVGSLASIFVFITISKPKENTATLLPILQSVWFIPHVLPYILSYSLLLLSTVVGYFQFYRSKKQQPSRELDKILDNLLSTGICFLIVGLLVGMQWANQAWGSYWSWDIKEIWALITLFVYLLVYHLRLRKHDNKIMLLLLTLGLVSFMITWLGIGYLPCKEGMHLYAMSIPHINQLS